MFEPEILAKQILLVAYTWQKSSKSSVLQDFVREQVDWLEINDEYAWDAEILTYLRDSINYAEYEQDKYGVNMDSFKEQFLYSSLTKNINKRVDGYVDFLLHPEEEYQYDTTFEAEELTNMIVAYEFLRPNIAHEIRNLIVEKNNPTLESRFNAIINNSKFLKKIYKDSDMITTVDELIRFFEVNSDTENIGIGITTYMLTTIHFVRKLKETENKALQELAQKYDVNRDEFEINEQQMMFEMDYLVYRRDEGHDMAKLTSFLKDVNSVIDFDYLSTGIEFRLRKLH